MNTEAKAETMTRDALQRVIAFLKNSPWEQEYLLVVERLLQKIDDPCVLAIAGRVNAGKSSIMNAYLQDDLAVVNATAATATINSFRYTEQEDKERPIKCIYKDGREERVTREFLDSIQGHNDSQRQEASRIRELQFFLNNPRLQQMTLVDTPGMGAAVEEHQKNAEEFLLQTKGADAILYVVGPVAGEVNVTFLKSFQKEFDDLSTPALNTIGVMSRVDEDDQFLAERHELASSCKEKLQGRLSAIVPVSAGLWRQICKNRQTGFFENLQQTVREKFSEYRLTELLKGHTTWKKDRDYKGECQLSAAERIELMGDMPWRVFVLIARELYAHPIEEAIARLTEYSGFTALESIIETHFFQRGKLLRYFNIISTLLTIFAKKIKYNGLNAYRNEIIRDKKQMIQFCDFIADHPRNKTESAEALRVFLSEHLRKDDLEEWREKTEEIIEYLQRVNSELDWINRKFEGLKLLGELPQKSTQNKEKEIEELRVLFGYYPGQAPERSTCPERQAYWSQMQYKFNDLNWQKLIELAELCYGHLFEQNEESPQ